MQNTHEEINFSWRKFLFKIEGKKSQMQVESHAQQQSGYNAIIKEDEGNGGSGSFSNNFKAINYVYADHNNLYQL